jgi:hypothetical protein
VTSIDLAAGAAGKAKIVVHAKPRVVQPLPIPLTVQLRSHGECWGASYIQAGVKKNTNSEFVANSSPSGAFHDTRRRSTPQRWSLPLRGGSSKS